MLDIAAAVEDASNSRLTALVAVTVQSACLGRPLALASEPATIREAPQLAQRDQQSQGHCTR
jgi:hypothetical protein